MTKIRFYTDENVPKAVVTGLRKRGVDVLSVPEANMLEADDEAQFRFAFKQQRVIFTRDDDFLSLAMQPIEHAGIVYASQQRSIGTIIRGLMLIYEVLSMEEMRNHIEFL